MTTGLPRIPGAENINVSVVFASGRYELEAMISAAALAALRLLAVLSLYCLRRRALPARLYENLGSRAFSGDLPRSDAVQAVEKCDIKLLRTSIATQKAAPESQKTLCIKRGRSAGRFSESSMC